MIVTPVVCVCMCVTVWYPIIVCNLMCVLQDWTQWEALGPGLCACVSSLYNSGSRKGMGGRGANSYPTVQFILQDRRREAVLCVEKTGHTQWKRPRMKFVCVRCTMERHKI